MGAWPLWLESGVGGDEAYLHRKEGGSSNAGYWYRRANKPPAQSPLDQEWLQIAESLLGDA